MAVGCAVIKIYIVCVINKYVLKIPLLICVNGRSKSYVCLQLSLGGDAAWCVLMSDWLLRHIDLSWAVPECSSACAQPRSCSAAEGLWAKVGLDSSRGKQRCHRCLPQCLVMVWAPANGMVQLAMVNITFINSCYGNGQIFINHLKRSPLPLGFAALEHGEALLTRFPKPGVLPGFDEFTMHRLGILSLHPPPGCLLQTTLEISPFSHCLHGRFTFLTVSKKLKKNWNFSLPLYFCLVWRPRWFLQMEPLKCSPAAAGLSWLCSGGAALLPGLWAISLQRASLPLLNLWPVKTRVNQKFWGS